MQISFADILRVKREAKKLRRQLPGKSQSHNDLLSLAAHNCFGVRNFHELTKLREKTINQHLVWSDNTATCSFCRFLFCPDLAEDRKIHQTRHDAFEEAVSALNYTPQAYSEREASKKQGHELRTGENQDAQMEGSLMILRAWFDRSLERAIDDSYWKQHPAFEEYVACLVGDLDDFPPLVVQSLEQKYGRTDGVIPKGRSYWYPPRK